MKKIDISIDFPTPDNNSWQLAAEKLLKGKPIATLHTKTYENITLNPIYSEEKTKAFSGVSPIINFKNYDGNPWYILQNFAATTPEEFNIRLKRNLSAGQNALFLTIAQDDQFFINLEHWLTVFKDIELEKMPLFIKSALPAKKIYHFIQKTFKEYSHDIAKLKGAIFFDPLAQKIFSKNGDFNAEAYYNDLLELTSSESKDTPDFGILSCDATVYHNAGANAVQELAFAMAAAVESIQQIQKSNPNLDFLYFSRNIDFNFSIGSNFFMEIAKLRAARILWQNVINAFDLDSNPKMRIHAETSIWNKTILDEHTNILRATTEGFSAIVGGCDTLMITPHSFLTEKKDISSERIAHNIQLILQDEVHADKVNDVASGSWYVESLTKSVAEKSWALFQEIEQQGGMLAALKNDFVQKKIAETRGQRLQDIETRRKKVIGVNIFPNLNDEHSEIEHESARAAEPFEKIRLKMENHAAKNTRPEVLLLNFGAIDQYKTRADFARGFFEVAGFKVTEKLISQNDEPDNSSEAKIIIFCSSDRLYPDFVPSFSKKLKTRDSGVKLIVAGNPTEHLDAFKHAGVDDFIHIKSNVYTTLNRLMNEIGID